MKAICRTCGLEFDQEPVNFLGTVIAQTHCDNCIHEEKNKAKIREKQRSDERINEVINNVIPSLYRNTAIDLLPESAKNIIDNLRNSENVFLVGKSGLGKTRLGVLLAIRQITKGNTPRILLCSELGLCMLGGNQNDLYANLERFYHCDWLLIDDFGKQKMTESVEAHLFGIIEHRIVHQLPTCITSNMDSSQMRVIFGEDKFNPFLRRIKEFYKVIKL
jgi:DNA replication protein DnaC